MSGPARRLWAKSGDGNGHGLLAHLLDVAAVAEVLLRREPTTTLNWAATRLGIEVAQVPRWVAAMAGLHDFGKATPGFQGLWPEGGQRDLAAGLSFPAQACAVTRHDAATAALLPQVWAQFCDAPQAWLRHVVAAISAHHGFHLDLMKISRARPVREPAEWWLARQEILQAYCQCLAPSGLPSQPALDLPALNWLAGITSIADWIASNPLWFAQGERCEYLLDYFARAQLLAEQALDQIHWRRGAIGLDPAAHTASLMAQILGRQDQPPRPLQLAGDDLLVTAQGPSLLLVEAPMGEGKTELALLAYLRLQAVNQHRGLYMALPTQATGNAMFRRLQSFLERFVTTSADIQLVHGGAAMQPDWVRLQDVAHSSHETLSASSWFAQRRRPLLSPYGVGTIDQALLAVLRSKHHFVRLWGLSNRVVVLDEVHAYDTYTSGLILALLGWLKALGSSVILMSATLPRQRRQQLLAAWDPALDLSPVEPDYPRLSLADRDGLRQTHVAARTMAALRLQAMAEGVDAMAAQALALVAEGGCVAIVVNTVDRAQKLFALLQASCQPDTVLSLFHARFPADQRSELEQQVLAQFGLSGTRPLRAILVATQVVEQSLDVDFDVMLSDLAPVDLLLQRAGRLHRHARGRPPAHAVPRLWVAGLHAHAFPDLKTTRWGYVYDPYILARSWAFLRHVQTCQLPQDIDRWVQQVYDDEAFPLPEDLEASWRDYIDVEALGEHLFQVKQQRILAFHVAVQAGDDPDLAYDDKREQWGDVDALDEACSTRLGPESITLVPVYAGPAGWSLTPQDPAFDPARPLPPGLAELLYKRQLKISRPSLVRHFKAQPPCPAFADQVLLRHFHPLPLSQDGYDADGEWLRLDPQLGLVFAATKQELVTVL